ncbi:MAG: MFS transporter [Phycisphaeraceae bacterium]|nr:MFS transporter [Phycisphaeraceae bacterium]
MSSTPPSRPLLSNVSFHLLWISTFASGMGDRLIMNAALPMLGYGEAGGNSSIVAGIDFFFFLPYLIWSPMAGWLADRLPRKWLMFGADEMRALIVLGAFLYIPVGTDYVPEDHHWKVWATILAVGVMAASFVPAKLSVVPNVVGYERLQSANAAVVAMGVIGNLIGFLVGGLLAENSVRSMVLVSSLSYGVSGTFWFFLKTPYKRPENQTHGPIEAHGASPAAVLRQIIDGVRYAWTHKPVWMLILAASLVWTGTSVYLPALGVVNVKLYGGDASDFMFVAAPVGAGMLLGSIALGVLDPKRGLEIVMVAGLVLCGFFIGLQMLVPIAWVGKVIALSTGVGAAMLMVPLNTLLQRITPDHIRGRVFAAKEVFAELGKVGVSFVIWKVAHSDPWMIPTAGVLAAVLIAAGVWGLFRYVRRGPMDRGGQNFLWRLNRLLASVVHRLQIRGGHHVPATGPVLLVANHTSGVDPVLVQAGVRRQVRWMMAHEFMNRMFNWLWKRIDVIPVRRDESDAASARRAVEALKQGQVVGIFPEGHIRTNAAIETMDEMTAGASMIARRGGATVVPIWIAGTPWTEDPYWAILRPSRSTVTFGPPFKLEEAGRDRAAQVEMIRSRLEALAESQSETDAETVSDPAAESSGG